MLWCNKVVKIVARLLLVKWYDIKMVKSPYNCVIYLLTQPLVANQQEKKKVSIVLLLVLKV